MNNLADRILELLGKPTYQAVKPKALARKLGISATDYAHFRQVLRDLARQKRIEFGRNHTVQPLRPPGSVAGIFRKTNAGFGFVRPHPTEALAGQDIYIRPQAVGDASTGDEVLVRLIKRSRRPDRGPEGEIIRVLERDTHQFVGVYFEEGGEGFVRVDGHVFPDPIYVGDPGAKGARPDDKVVFEMIRFPSPRQRGEGVITEILGPRGQPGIETLSVIRAYELPDEFPPEVLREARRQAEAFDEEALNGREDFTNDPVITIDPPDAHDFDDAVFLRYDSSKRHWHLAVHVADVAHFVPPGSQLDREARNRGNSVYLPQRVLPMFPEILSNGLASLQEGRLRYVKSVLMEFTHGGQRASVRFVNGAIRVRKRFTYEQVTDILEHPERHRSRLAPELLDMLHKMREFSQILKGRRIKRGALELVMPETELDYDEQGNIAGAHVRPHDISHQIIEEFMLAANEAVAEHLAERDIIFLRRVHMPPAPDKLRDFLEFVATLGYDVALNRPTDRFQLQRLLSESANKPEGPAVHYALLRSLKQAEYSPLEEGHYALASDCYCHFTSPIRRYPDLTVHRLLDQWLRTGRAGSDETELVALGEHCSYTERRADDAERELIKIKLLEYMAERIGMEMEAVVTGVQEYGFFAQGLQMPVEGRVHVSTLRDDFYYFDSMTHSLIGRRTRRRFRLGDKVQVRVVRVDLQRRQLDFQVVEERRSRR